MMNESVNHNGEKSAVALLFMGRNFKAFSTCGQASISDVAANVIMPAAGTHLL